MRIEKFVDAAAAADDDDNNNNNNWNCTEVHMCTEHICKQVLINAAKSAELRASTKCPATVCNANSRTLRLTQFAVMQFPTDGT